MAKRTASRTTTCSWVSSYRNKERTPMNRSLLACLLSCLALAACNKSEPKPAEAPATGTAPAAEAPKKDETLKVGFVYVGPRDDFGYNQAHHEGAKFLTGL